MTLDRTTVTSARPLTISDIDELYQLRHERIQHPRGAFDKAGRWYPAEDESASCCRAIRLPSRAHPYSYMVHCRTRKHLETWYLEQVCAPLVAELFALFSDEGE